MSSTWRGSRYEHKYSRHITFFQYVILQHRLRIIQFSYPDSEWKRRTRMQIASQFTNAQFANIIHVPIRCLFIIRNQIWWLFYFSPLHLHVVYEIQCFHSSFYLLLLFSFHSRLQNMFSRAENEARKREKCHQCIIQKKIEIIQMKLVRNYLYSAHTTAQI